MGDQPESGWRLFTGHRGLAADSSGSADHPGETGNRPPQRSQAPARPWVRRAEHDRRARARLEFLDGDGVIVLNDRRIPESRTNITPIAISSAGVFVVDVRSQKGFVHVKHPGNLANLGPAELHIGRHDCSGLVAGVVHRVEAVRSVLSADPWPAEVPVHGMLCLTRAEWGFASAIQINDIWVGWPKLMAGRIRQPGVMDSPAVQEISTLIAEKLPST
ncbi:MAG: nuclease-related domain-containing protein [Acidimicrobiales bacterium]